MKCYGHVSDIGKRLPTPHCNWGWSIRSRA